ncbi:MAG: hypothetical protein ABJQ89_16930, partial [Planktotalea sp.]
MMNRTSARLRDKIKQRQQKPLEGSDAIRDLFDGESYLRANGDVLAAQIDPLHHFKEYGRFEGRSPSDWFTER